MFRSVAHQGLNTLRHHHSTRFLTVRKSLHFNIVCSTNHHRFMSSSDDSDLGSDIEDLESLNKPSFVHPECTPFQAYYITRDWKSVSQYWGNLLIQDETTWPNFVKGGIATNSPYGLTDLSKVFQAGKKGEFLSTDQRYLRRNTYAMRIGYRGDSYHGYQFQGNVDRAGYKLSSRRTVEGDLTRILNATVFGAGRTDRGVHALSQVVCFSSNYGAKLVEEDKNHKANKAKKLSTEEIPSGSTTEVLDSERQQDTVLETPSILNDEQLGEHFIQKFQQSDASIDNRLRVYQCYRVPKRFHSRSSALWRRYLYLFPLTIAEKNRNVSFPMSLPSIDSDSVAKDALGGDEMRKMIEYKIDIDRLNRILGA